MSVEHIVIAIVYAAITYGYSKYQKSKLRKQARERNVVNERLSPAGGNLGRAYGRGATTGHLTYFGLGSTVPPADPNNKNGAGALSSSTATKTLGGISDAYSKRRKFLYTEYAITALPIDPAEPEGGEINKIVRILDNERNFVQDTEIAGQGVATWNNTERAAMAAHFSSSQRPTATTLYRGIGAIGVVWRLNLDKPQFSGIPFPLFEYEAHGLRKVVQDSSGNYSVGTQLDGHASNAVLALLDYLLAKNTVGPALSEDDLDLSTFYEYQDRAEAVMLGQGSSHYDDVIPDETKEAWHKELQAQLTQARTIQAISRITAQIVVLGYTPGDPDADPNPSAANVTYEQYYAAGDLNRGEGLNQYGQNIPVIRYSFNGVTRSENDYPTAIEEFLAVMPGSILYRKNNGKIALFVPHKDINPQTDYVLEITDRRLLGPVEILYPNDEDKLNKLTIRYNNIQSGFAEDSADFNLHAARAVDSRELSDTIQLTGINNIYNAQAVAWSLINISRRPAFTFEVTPVGMLLEHGDIVYLNTAAQNLRRYVVIIDKTVNKDFTAKLTAVEFVPSDYEFIIDEKQEPKLPIRLDEEAKAPSQVTISIANQDDQVVSLNITWDQPADQLATVDRYQVEKNEDSTGWQFAATVSTGEADSEDANITITQLATPGVSQITYRVRAATARNTTSSWRESPSFNIPEADFSAIEGTPGAPGPGLEMIFRQERCRLGTEVFVANVPAGTHSFRVRSSYAGGTSGGSNNVTIDVPNN